MPENTPMKKQWITVDGRQTPIILPQIWDHNLKDWVVTSEQHPLPTQVTGSKVEEVIMVDNVEIEANSYISMAGSLLEKDNCDEIWFVVNNNANPISLSYRTFTGNGIRVDSFYPYNPLTSNYPSAQPYYMLYHRNIADRDDVRPNNISEAKELIMPYNFGEDYIGRIYNDSDVIATVSVKALKIWRK